MALIVCAACACRVVIMSKRRPQIQQIHPGDDCFFEVIGAIPIRQTSLDYLFPNLSLFN